MDKAELSACMEQSDSKEASVLLRDALQNKMSEALMEMFEEEVQGLCGPSHSRVSKSSACSSGAKHENLLQFLVTPCWELDIPRWETEAKYGNCYEDEEFVNRSHGLELLLG